MLNSSQERMFQVTIVWYVIIHVGIVEDIWSAGPSVNFLWI